MAWDPTVLRKYSTTSHFRLLNQVRAELNAQPIARHPGGEINLGISRRGSSYRVPVEVRGASGAAKPARPSVAADGSPGEGQAMDSTSFRDRLRAIEMR
ncbi:MAG: hypothetical protein FJ083_03400 [Cyanobacteria bacterium K_Offshore_surface_m2_239]|nr:hypothetical protein [Cyanobacteria bacterium K_Offshore_surface_m2_239]